MVDINARINWQPGMELSAQTFKELAENLDFRMRTMNTIANNNRIGILPNSEFNCQGIFVRNILEINHFRCRAILPSGRIVDADEDIMVKIPLLYGNKYYLTIGFGKDEINFDKEEVSFVRPQYLYEIHTLEEVEQDDSLPIMRFKVDEGIFTIDPTFIPPSLLINCNPQYVMFLDSYTEEIRELAEHSNLEDGEGKRCLLNLYFSLKGYDKQASTQDFIQKMQEVAYAIDYYVMRPNTENRQAIPQPSQFDLEEWLTWLKNYLQGAKSILDGIILQDNSIDYEKLKEEITADVYQRAYQEIYEQLRKEILEKFNPNMEQQIKEELTSYIQDVIRPEINESLKEELTSSLYDKLYPALYNALYDALFVPEEETEQQEEFVPQI